MHVIEIKTDNRSVVLAVEGTIRVNVRNDLVFCHTVTAKDCEGFYKFIGYTDTEEIAIAEGNKICDAISTYNFSVEVNLK